MIPIYKPSIKRKEMDALLSTLVSDYIDSKNDSGEFIKALSLYLGLENGALLRDYSTAIETVLGSMNLDPGSRVLLSPLAPSNYLRVLEKMSLSVVYTDVDPSSCAVSYEEMETKLNAGADAVILYSPSGISPEYPMLEDAGIPVIEDITTSITGIREDSEKGWRADYFILRMELQDIITSGEGTAVFGTTKRSMTPLRSVLAEIPETARLLNMHAAMGQIQLDSIDHFLERRREIGKIFESSLLKGSHKTFHSPLEGDRNYPCFHVVLNCPMKEISKYARKNGVMTELAFSDTAIALETEDSSICPAARSLLLRTAVFPLYPGLGTKNTETIARLLSTLP